MYLLVTYRPPIRPTKIGGLPGSFVPSFTTFDQRTKPSILALQMCPNSSLEISLKLVSSGPKSCPMRWNRDSGIRVIFAWEIWNPGLWIPEYSSRNPLESRIQVSLTKNPESRAALNSLTLGEKTKFSK